MMSSHAKDLQIDSFDFCGSPISNPRLSANLNENTPSPSLDQRRWPLSLAALPHEPRRRVARMPEHSAASCLRSAAS